MMFIVNLLDDLRRRATVVTAIDKSAIRTAIAEDENSGTGTPSRLFNGSNCVVMLDR